MNIGTAENLFSALKESLNKYNLDFSKATAADAILVIVCRCCSSTTVLHPTQCFGSFCSLKNRTGARSPEEASFMSDTTNVMKGARSGFQKRIKRETFHPSL